MLCSSCHSASGRSNTCSFSFKQRAQFRQLVAPFHRGRGDQADHEGRAGADRGHDQDGRHGAGNPVAFEKARRRRQHGADDERHHDREEERLGGIEHGDDADDQQRHQREGDDLGAADDRRQFGLAVGHRRAFASARWTFDVRRVLPCAQRLCVHPPPCVARASVVRATPCALQAQAWWTNALRAARAQWFSPAPDGDDMAAATSSANRTLITGQEQQSSIAEA